MTVKDIPILLRPLHKIPQGPRIVIPEQPTRIPEGFIIERPMPSL